MLLGIALLIAPVAIFQAGIGEPTWEYGAAEIAVEDDGIHLPDAEAIPGRVYIDNIVCTDEVRACALERHVREEGGLPVAAATFRRVPYGYVSFDDGIVATATAERDGTTYLTHEPVEPRAALRNSSIAYDRSHPAYRAAVDRGEATATTWIETPMVVTKAPQEPGEAFYYVYEIHSPGPGNLEPNTAERVVPWLLAIISFLVGLGLVLHAQRRRIRREQWYQEVD